MFSSNKVNDDDLSSLLRHSPTDIASRLIGMLQTESQSLSRECLILSCLPKPSFADMACCVGGMPATSLVMSPTQENVVGRNDMTFEDMSDMSSNVCNNVIVVSAQTKTLW
jgi:hypothetical protein